MSVSISFERRLSKLQTCIKGTAPHIMPQDRAAPSPLTAGDGRDQLGAGAKKANESIGARPTEFHV